MNQCVLCGKEIIGYGHNASPLADGQCCDECNTLVIKARLERFVEELAVEENKNCSKQED